MAGNKYLQLLSGSLVEIAAIQTSAGAGDAGKIAALDAAGKFDPSMIPTGVSVAFSSLTSATNTAAAMVVGTGASLAATGSGTITATAVPASGITGTTLAATVTASSITSFGVSIALGTPASGTLTNCTGTASGLTAGNVTTNANLTGDVTSVGNATTLTNAPVIAKVLTGYVSGAGTVAATDTILQAIQKLNGNDATNANLTGDVTSVGNATTLATVNANVGSFGSSTSIPTFTVNGKGLITAASGNAVVAPAGTLTGATLAAGVTASSLTSVGTITTGTWNGTDIAVADGGTGRSTGTTAYSLIATGTTATGAQQTLANGATTEILVGGGAAALPLWTTATGSGAPVRAGSPTFATNITTPLVIGGTATTSTLTYKPTSGVGTTGADHIFQVGNNGATEVMRIENSGDVGIGTAAPTSKLHVTESSPASVGTTPATAAGSLVAMTGAVGGATSIATTGVGGVGGTLTLTGGAGGLAASAVTASTGGAGGSLTNVGGAGGAAAVAGTGSNTGGAGGAITVTTGTGGAATGDTTGNNTGGAGGALSVSAGTGGAASNVNAAPGVIQGGAGGNFTISAGVGGAGTGGTAGAGGALIFRTALTTSITERARIDKTGNFLFGTSTTPTNATANFSFGGGASTPVLGAATADIVSLAAVDKAAGDRRLYIQSESGSAISLGNDRLNFAAATGIVSIGGTDTITATSALVSVPTLKATTTIGVGAATPSASGAGITFPATANLSSDANTFDDYEEGDWVPAITFATNGNLSVTYSVQLAKYTKKGREVTLIFAMVTSAFTHTTASGNLQITGAPFQCDNGTNLNSIGSFAGAGITKAGYTMLQSQINNAGTTIFVSGYQSGAAISVVAAADMPTGGSVILRGVLTYNTNS